MIRNRSSLVQINTTESNFLLRTSSIYRKRMWSRFRSLALRTCILNTRPLLHKSSFSIRQVHRMCGLTLNKTLLHYFSTGFNLSTLMRSHFSLLYTLLNNQFKLFLTYGLSFKSVFSWNINRYMFYQAEFFVANKLALLPVNLVKYNLSQFSPFLFSKIITFIDTSLRDKRRYGLRVVLNKTNIGMLNDVSPLPVNQLSIKSSFVGFTLNIYKLVIYLTLWCIYS